MVRRQRVSMDMVFRQAIHPGAPTPWRFIFWWFTKHAINAISALIFFITVAPKIWLFLYAGYPIIWFVGVIYIAAKMFDLFFEMPWWFEMFDLLTIMATLPSRIIEASGIVPPDPPASSVPKYR